MWRYLVLVLPAAALAGFGFQFGTDLAGYAWDRLWDWYMELDKDFGKVGFIEEHKHPDTRP